MQRFFKKEYQCKARSNYIFMSLWLIGPCLVQKSCQQFFSGFYSLVINISSKFSICKIRKYFYIKVIYRNIR